MTPTDPAVAPFVQWMFQQGGAIAICIVVMFFYRRDWKTVNDVWREQHATMMDLVRSSIAAQERMTAALAENTMVMHSLKRAVEAAYFGRRAVDQALQDDAKRPA